MRPKTQKFSLGILVLGLLAIAGCSSFYVVDRTMTIQEIIAMSKADVDSDVMIAQIDATHTRFALTSEDLILLKNAGVPDDVVEHMIDTGITPERYAWEHIYDPIVGYPYYEYYPFYHSFYYPSYTIYHRGGPYRMYYPYVVRRVPGIVGRFYEYYPVPGYRSTNRHRPSRGSDDRGGESNGNSNQHRRPESSREND